jgi:hypothetical protein
MRGGLALSLVAIVMMISWDAFGHRCIVHEIERDGRIIISTVTSVSIIITNIRIIIIMVSDSSIST